MVDPARIGTFNFKSPGGDNHLLGTGLQINNTIFPFDKWIEQTMEWMDRECVQHNWDIEDSGDGRIRTSGFNWYRWGPNKELFRPKATGDFELRGYPWNVEEFWKIFRDNFNFMQDRLLLYDDSTPISGRIVLDNPNYDLEHRAWRPQDVARIADSGKFHNYDWFQYLPENYSGLLHRLTPNRGFTTFTFSQFGNQQDTLGFFEKGGKSVTSVTGSGWESSDRVSIVQSGLDDAFSNYQSNDWTFPPGNVGGGNGVSNIFSNNSRIGGADVFLKVWVEGVNRASGRLFIKATEVDIFASVGSSFWFGLYPLGYDSIENYASGVNRTLRSLTGIDKSTISTSGEFFRRQRASEQVDGNFDAPPEFQETEDSMVVTFPGPGKLKFGFVNVSGLRPTTNYNVFGGPFIDVDMEDNEEDPFNSDAKIAAKNIVGQTILDDIEAGNSVDILEFDSISTTGDLIFKNYQPDFTNIANHTPGGNAIYFALGSFSSDESAEIDPLAGPIIQAVDTIESVPIGFKFGAPEYYTLRYVHEDIPVFNGRNIAGQVRVADMFPLKNEAPFFIRNGFEVYQSGDLYNFHDDIRNLP